MSILIKDSCNFLVATPVMLAVCVAPGNVYAQQSTDKTRATSMPADKNNPPSKSGKKDGEMIVEIPVLIKCAGAPQKAMYQYAQTHEPPWLHH